MSLTCEAPGRGAEVEISALPKRRFGRTGENVPVLGLGTAPAGFALSDSEAAELYHTALDRGVTYFDTAPGYKNAQKQLGQVLPQRRDEVFLATKAWCSTAREAIEIHEQSLKDLRLDCVDLLYAHCVGSFEPEELLAKGGVFDGLREAKRRGLTRFIGFTAHHHTERPRRLLRELDDIDCVMLAMNYADRFTYGFEDRVLPLAREADLGVAAMKVFGGARDMDYENQRDSHLGRRDHAPAFRYALGLPGVATAVVGMFNLDELDLNLRWACNWRPLDEREERMLESEGRRIAREWGPHFGDAE